MSRQPGGIGWSLEVVRGREVGRRFALGAGETVLGSGVGNGQGIDLSSQEGDSPRRMAARQAVIDFGSGGPVLRDLESPGGTFVNRRRLLPGQGLTLQGGDVIQLGGVQLRVDATPKLGRATAPDRPQPPPRPATAAAAPDAVPKPTRPAVPPASKAAAPLAFSLQGGPVCRGWDEFLAVSAQRWDALREELTSGRLASYLISAGRAEFAPKADAPGSPDERLDAWLGTLPTTRQARPELDVHPRSLAFRATPGARSRQVVRVANVGFRLLRSRARVEPADAGWVSVPSGFARGFATVEETEVPVEVAVPDPFPGRMSAAVVIEGNGGSARVAVTLEPAGVATAGPFGEAETLEMGSPAFGELAGRFAGWLSRRGAGERAIGGAVLGLATRLGVGVACGLSGAATLPGPAVVLATTGAVAGAMAIGRKAGVGDVPAGAFAGGFGGLVAAAMVVAACQAVEPVLGASLSGNLLATATLWAMLGAASGAGSVLVVPAGRGGAS